MSRYIVSVWEDAKVQYEVSAASEDEAREKYERGEVAEPLLDEHEAGEVVDVKRL